CAARRGVDPATFDTLGPMHGGDVMASSLTLHSDLQPMLAELAREFPFEAELSLAPLVRFWDEVIAHEDTVRGRLGPLLQTELRRAPALAEPIHDLSVLSRHGQLVEALMTAVFPSVFWEREHAAALIPFQLKSFYATAAFQRDLMGPESRLRGRLNVDKQTLG